MATETTSINVVHLEDPAVARPGKEPKILRLRVNEFEGEGRGWEQYVNVTVEQYNG